jgi:hypothetical protein
VLKVVEAVSDTAVLNRLVMSETPLLAEDTATPAALTTALTPSRLVHVSACGILPAGGALNPGFQIKGTRNKSVLIRAAGPALQNFGVRAALARTAFNVVAQDSRELIAENSGWESSMALNDVFVRVGAFPFAPGSHDSAVQTTLSPGGYAVSVSAGDPLSSGVALAEIYDADPDGSAGRITNVSTLGFVGSGETALCVGIVISGGAPKRLLVRVVGPGLAAFNIENTLADPRFTITPLQGREAIAANDDWSDDAEVRTAVQNIGAFSLAPGTKDAAIVTTLAPGAYTIIAAGAGMTTGTALVEIYDLDP